MARRRRITFRGAVGAAALCGLVLCRGLPRAAAEDAPPASPAAAAPLLDLNQADTHALVELPGIGESRARAIVAYREARGGFRSVHELLKIRGIGRKLLAKLRTRVMVRAPAGEGRAHPVR